jgi:hypothetical protein
MFRFTGAGILCCLVAGVVPAQENLKRLDVFSLGKVGLVNGELRAGADRVTGWKLRKTPHGVLIYSAGGEKIGAWGGWYLNYDHKGKDSRVGLVPDPGPGCYWIWSEGARKKNVGGFGYTFPCTAQPAHGPMRGWSLTFDAKKLVLAKQPKLEVSFTGTIDDLNDGK